MQTFVLGGLSAWMPTYFHRFFDMDVARAGLVFGGMVIAAGALGTFLGGKIADRLLKKTNYAYFLVIAASFILMIPFAGAGVVSHRMPFSLITFFIAMVFIFLPQGPVSAALVALSSRKVRSMAFAVNIFIMGCLSVLLPACLFLHLSAKFARAEGRLIRYYAQDGKEA